MQASLSARLAFIALAGALVSASVPLWLSSAVSPGAGWLFAVALPLAAAAAAWFVLRTLLAQAAGRLMAFARRLEFYASPENAAIFEV